MENWPAPLIGERDAPEACAQPQALYRFYCADGTLLYVGRTHDPRMRFSYHRYHKPWWDEIARRTVTWYASRKHVIIAERMAIRNENPEYNENLKPRRGRLATARPTVAEAVAAVQALQALQAADRAQSVRGVIKTVKRALVGIRGEAMARATDDGPDGITKAEMGRRLGTDGWTVSEEVTTWRSMGEPDPFDGFPADAELELSGIAAAIAALRSLAPAERALEAKRLAGEVRPALMADAGPVPGLPEEKAG